MLFFLQKPPTNTQNVYMKYISYLKILNIAMHNYYTECCFFVPNSHFSDVFANSLFSEKG